jgi:hypothetical protein
MNQIELLVNTSSGQMLAKDLPNVQTESVTSQNVRMTLTIGILAIVSIMFLYALNSQDYNCFFNMNIKTNDLPVSYAAENIDEEKYMKGFVMGSKIQVHSLDDTLLIEYIIPQFSSQAPIGEEGSVTGYYKYFGASYNGLEPILSITQDKGKGSVYEIDLVNDQPISMIAIMGSEDEKEYKKLDTAKVIIRNEEGKKVWTSSQFLKPTQFNYVRVVTD